MLALKYFLMSSGFVMTLVAVAILGYDVRAEILYRRAASTPRAVMPQIPKARLRTSIALALLAYGPILLAFSTVMTTAGISGCM